MTKAQHRAPQAPSPAEWQVPQLPGWVRLYGLTMALLGRLMWPAIIRAIGRHR